MRPSGIVTLLTDFGAQDPYVGAMKGVILSINPSARVVDIAHEVGPQDIRGAAFCMLGYLPYFPHGTVHVCVVDPGVGGPRRAIAVETSEFYLVGPDNGVFTLAVMRFGYERAVLLENRELFRARVSHTFHGRDIFAPVAAHLSCGVRLESFGREIDGLTTFDWRGPRIEGDRLAGEVVRFDRFGNAITNIDEAALGEFLAGAEPVVVVGKLVVSGMVSSYAEAEAGEPCVLLDSYGFIEIAVPTGSARESVGLSLGDGVWVKRSG